MSKLCSPIGKELRANLESELSDLQFVHEVLSEEWFTEEQIPSDAQKLRTLWLLEFKPSRIGSERSTALHR